MAKSTKNAVLICTICTLFAALGIAVGIWKHLPLVAVIGMIPAAAYEVYRTEGFMTKLASIGILALLVIILVMIAFKLSFNIAPFLKSFGITRAVNVTLAAPIIMAVLAFMLFRDAGGIYTKWLAVIILLSAIGLFYILDPALLQLIFKSGSREGLRNVRPGIPGGYK